MSGLLPCGFRLSRGVESQALGPERDLISRQAPRGKMKPTGRRISIALHQRFLQFERTSRALSPTEYGYRGRQTVVKAVDPA
jgi:hypothetical protein